MPTPLAVARIQGVTRERVGAVYWSLSTPDSWAKLAGASSPRGSGLGDRARAGSCPGGPSGM